MKYGKLAKCSHDTALCDIAAPVERGVSMRLMEGANIHQIATNCRTSIGMIEKYYGVHVKNSLNAAAINVARSGKDVMAEKEV